MMKNQKEMLKLLKERVKNLAYNIKTRLRPDGSLFFTIFQYFAVSFLFPYICIHYLMERAK